MARRRKPKKSFLTKLKRMKHKPILIGILLSCFAIGFYMRKTNFSLSRFAQKTQVVKAAPKKPIVYKGKIQK